MPLVFLQLHKTPTHGDEVSFTVDGAMDHRCSKVMEYRVLWFNFRVAIAGNAKILSIDVARARWCVEAAC